MAQIANQAQENNKLMVVDYKVATGETIKLDADTVRKYLVSGSGRVSDQEIIMYMNICKSQKLNPFIKECYCIKYSDSDPATIVVGKEAFLKRAERHPDYRGKEDGVIVVDKNNNIIERKGALVLPQEKLVGGWARVYRKGYDKPIETAVSLDEYIGRKRDGTPNQNWASRPASMVKKVALVQCLRESFPQSLGGMYTEDEIDSQITNEINEPVYDIPDMNNEINDTIIIEGTPETENNETENSDDGCFEIDYRTEYLTNKDIYERVNYPNGSNAYNETTKKIRVRRK